MQRYARRFGIKYQDLVLMNNQEKMEAFSEDLAAAASKVAAYDKEAAHLVGRAARLFDIVIKESIFVPRDILPPDEYPNYLRFMRGTATEQEMARDQRYRQLLGSARRRGFVSATRFDPT